MATIEDKIAELESKANKLAQTAKIRPVDSDAFNDYREGFLDGERLTASAALEIITALQIELKQIRSQTAIEIIQLMRLGKSPNQNWEDMLDMVEKTALVNIKK